MFRDDKVKKEESIRDGGKSKSGRKMGYAEEEEEEEWWEWRMKRASSGGF